MKTIEGMAAGDLRAAALFRALGNPARVQIIRALAAQPGCMTGDLADLLPLAQSTVSEHLRVLKEAGIVRGTIEGDRCYCLDPEALQVVVRFCQQLCEAGCEPGAPGRC